MQDWHYSKREVLHVSSFAGGKSIFMTEFSGLVHPDFERARNVILVGELGFDGLSREQWFAANDREAAEVAYSARVENPDILDLEKRPLNIVPVIPGDDYEVANCRKKGKDMIIRKAAGLFYVTWDGRRTQVRLNDEALCRYLVNAIEDGS
jgi:hypothetical protein